MRQYIELLAHIIKNGTRQANRTGVNTISFPGAMAMVSDVRIEGLW